MAWIVFDNNLTEGTGYVVSGQRSEEGADAFLVAHQRTLTFVKADLGVKLPLDFRTGNETPAFKGIGQFWNGTDLVDSRPLSGEVLFADRRRILSDNIIANMIPVEAGLLDNKPNVAKAVRLWIEATVRVMTISDNILNHYNTIYNETLVKGEDFIAFADLGKWLTSDEGYYHATLYPVGAWVYTTIHAELVGVGVINIGGIEGTPHAGIATNVTADTTFHWFQELRKFRHE